MTNYNENEVRKTIEILKPDNALFEIRILENSKIISGYFTSVDTMLAELKRLTNRNGINIYIVMNTVNDACYARPQKDRFIEHPKHTTSDKDIIRRDWLLIDVDPERPAGVSSTKEELKRSQDVSKAVIEYLTSLGFSDPVIARSGNGTHLMYKISLPNDDAGRDLIKGCLIALNGKFSNNGVKIDTAVFNASRVTKLYGTMAKKGTHTEERPHRLSKLISAPDEIKITKEEALRELAGQAPQEKSTRSNSGSFKSDFDVYAWLDKYGLNIKEDAPHDGGRKLILEECPFDSAHKGKDVAVFIRPDGSLGFKCFHDSCSSYGWKELRQKFEPDAYDKEPTYQRRSAEEDFDEYEDLEDSLKHLESLTSANFFEDDYTFRRAFVLNAVDQQKYVRALRDRALSLKIRVSDLNDTIRAHKKEYERLQDLNSDPGAGPEDAPEWFIDGQLDEVKFCEAYEKKAGICCINGQFYSVNGLVEIGQIENDIHQLISQYITRGVAKKVKDLVSVLKIQGYREPIQPNPSEINVLNGVLKTDGTFSPVKKLCINRLRVNYNPNAPEPKVWLGFLKDLLYEDDIDTLQEYLGYSLIPSTKAQTMCAIVGSGGEGKSRIGVVMSAMMGVSAVFGEINALETNRFLIASLENKLLFIDDDISMTGSADTKNLKKIITAESPMLIERKGVQQYDALLYTRLLVFGNGTLKALFDHSDGFFRRQIILTARPKPLDRVDDKNLIDKLLKELESILLWCFNGLQRLIANGFEITKSERTLMNLEEAKRDNCNIIDFLRDSNYVRIDPEAETTSRDLYEAYTTWCEDNAEIKLSNSTVTSFIKQRGGVLGLQYSQHIKGTGNREVRGFKGIEIAHGLNSWLFS